MFRFVPFAYRYYIIIPVSNYSSAYSTELYVPVELPGIGRSDVASYRPPGGTLKRGWARTGDGEAEWLYR